MPERGKSGFATVSSTYIRRVRRVGKRRVAGPGCCRSRISLCG